MSRPERALTRAWWACGVKQAETPEPKGKLDTMSGTPGTLAPAPSPVNGPEDGFPDWDQVNWGQAEENVRRLRQRIFAASQAGDLKRARSLQKMMLRSRSNALVSVRRVTEVNAGPQDGRGRRAHRARGLGEGRHGRLAPAWRGRVEAPARQAGIRPEEQREAPRPGDPCDRRPGAAGPDGQRAGTRVGGPVRAEVLRVPAGPGMPRRHRGHPRHRERQARQAAMGAGRRPPVGVRPAQPRPHPRLTWRLPRTGPGAPVAEGGSGRGRGPVRDRGGRPARRGDQPVAHERGIARHGGSGRGTLLPQR
jgi:hypothetical protein